VFILYHLVHCRKWVTVEIRRLSSEQLNHCTSETPERVSVLLEEAADQTSDSGFAPKNSMTSGATELIRKEDRK
jgi:hypothetical protein